MVKIKKISPALAKVIISIQWKFKISPRLFSTELQRQKTKLENYTNRYRVHFLVIIIKTTGKINKKKKKWQDSFLCSFHVEYIESVRYSTLSV